MATYVIDLESDGLLDTVTKIHVLGWHSLKTGKSGEIFEYEEMIRFFSQPNLTLICHNAIRYDNKVIKRILNFNCKAEWIDTLIIAWYLYPERKKYGLAYFGDEFGIKKPEVEDWVGQEREVYAHRVREDVKINLKLWQTQYEYLLRIYDGDKDTTKAFVRYLMFKMDCAAEQESVAWKLDIPQCKKNLDMFEAELTIKENILIELMPEEIKYRSYKKPKVTHKQDGTLSKLGTAWYETLDELGLDEDFDDVIKIERSREPGNPNSHVQLKKWLFELGWKPATYKFDKDKVTGVVRQIPQISLPFGKGICNSVKLLYEAEPQLEAIDDFYVIEHRIGILKGFLRNVDKYGYLQAQVAGLTNTLRFKHAVLVNLPGYTGKGDWRDGIHIRGLLIAPEGYVLCGSDMSSLEDRTKQHYMHFFDPEYVKSMQTPGFDPHLDLAEFGYEMTKGQMGVSPENIEWFKQWDDDKVYTKEEHHIHNVLKGERHTFKTVNYGAVYGAGAPTMSRSSGMPVDKCTVLLKAYWEKNWSVKEIAKACVIKTLIYTEYVLEDEETFDDIEETIIINKVWVAKEREQMWLQNPVSGYWYSLRYLKDRFSTLNQGTGVYCFDKWIQRMRKQGLKMCGQFHDEVITPVKNNLNSRSAVELIMKRSVQEVNSLLKLNRALDIDVQFGDNYAQIH